MGAYWIPEVTETPGFLQPDPMYNPGRENDFRADGWYAYVRDPNGQLGTRRLPGIGNMRLYSY